MPLQEPPPLVASTPELEAILDGSQTTNSSAPVSQPSSLTAPPPANPGPKIPDGHKAVPDTTTQPPGVSKGDDMEALETELGIVIDPNGTPAPAKKPEEVAPAKPAAKVAPASQPQAKKKEDSKAEEPAEADKGFKFDPFKSAKKPAKTEEQPEEQAEEQTEEAAEQAEDQFPKSARDYSGLTEEETRMFKQMSKPAYAKFRPVYDEYKKLKSNPPKAATAKPAIPENYFAHQEAYTLLPEYKQATGLHQQAQFENQYWAKQLSLIRAGKKWTELAIDEKGQYVAGDQRDADEVAEAEVINNMSKTNNILDRARQQVSHLQANAGNIYKQAAEIVRGAEKQYLPFYEDENNPHQELIQNVKKAFPAPFRDHPVTSFAAKMSIMAKELHKQLEEAHREIATLRSLKQESANRQPTNKTLGAAISSPSGQSNKTANDRDDISALNAALGENILG